MSTGQFVSHEPMANNSIIVSRDCNDYTRFHFCCCSNTSSIGNAELIGRYGSNVMNSYSEYIIRGNNDVYNGCFRVRSYYSSYRRCYSSYHFTSSYQGVYTCRMLDANGIAQDFSMGIYPNGFNSKLDTVCIVITHTAEVLMC